MEAIRKQASKLREQVAKQQQAILKQLGHIGSENLIVDESELQCHEQLQKLYDSTRAAKHFQRNIVRGVEGFATISSKQMEIGVYGFGTQLHAIFFSLQDINFELDYVVRKLAEDCCKYGSENQNSGSALACLSLHFGASHNLVEREGENFLRILRSQICEPLRASVGGAPPRKMLSSLDSSLRSNTSGSRSSAEVAKRRSKCKESEASSESSLKLQNAEAKLKELKSKMMTLGREATAAMSSVEVQQQRLTFQRLISMVNSERSFHQSAAAILEKLHVEMILQVQRSKSELESASVMRDLDFSRVQTEVISDGSGDLEPYVQKDSYFVAQLALRIVSPIIASGTSTAHQLSATYERIVPETQRVRFKVSIQDPCTVIAPVIPQEFFYASFGDTSSDIDTVVCTSSKCLTSYAVLVLCHRCSSSSLWHSPLGWYLSLQMTIKCAYVAQCSAVLDVSTSFCQVIHPFDAQADGELSLSVGDYVVVHQVTPNGWCEGECNGKSGWFPSAYMERREEAPTSKSTEDSSP
ncbi:hypothetical protein IFM89_000574 [Coptis chinensis]|uniref:SH3 domain-containing protein n=1 Tax=Coptis chinensis TaxID=261450 RepID=A0A835M849_9MAGN|nr:hypothetical protein IFM89_000574 [Coptis chinensis]